jgi:hypothetical protein
MEEIAEDNEAVSNTTILWLVMKMRYQCLQN